MGVNSVIAGVKWILEGGAGVIRATVLNVGQI